MLDETTPDTASDTTAASENSTAEAKPAKKAAAKRAPAKKAAAKKAPAKKAAAKKTAAAPAADAPVAEAPDAEAAPVAKAPARRTRKTAAKKVAEAPAIDDAAAIVADTPVAAPAEAEEKPAKKAAAKKAPAKKAAAKKAPAKKAAAKKTPATAAEVEAAVEVAAEVASTDVDASGTLPLFQAPEAAKKPARRTRKRAAAPVVVEPAEVALDELTEIDPEDEEALAAAAALAEATGAEAVDADAETESAADAEIDPEDQDDSDDEDSEDGTPSRRRRRRGGRRRRKSSPSGDSAESADTEDASVDAAAEESDETSSSSSDQENDEQGDDSGEGGSSSRRRRRRRRAGDSDPTAGDDPENTVVRVREVRKVEDQITAVSGSTRLEAKKQRRREGREAGRRRAPIVSEAEFLARREAVERVMVIRQRPDVTQIAVLEDKVLVEHYVARESQTSLIGNVYLGRVQNVLPSMEAAFVDIGKGRNAVLYAGEVNWAALGHKDGKARKIESVLSPGQPILVQVTKDPVGHKGARLTSQVSLAGRFLVYVPDGTTSGISRKLPDTERARLKSLLKEIVPESAGVIVRTAAEGASEEELTSDVERLKARWEDIERKAQDKGKGAQLLYGEPDLTLKVVRDLFTEDFTKLVIEGEDAWQTVQGYVENVAPDLAERLEKYEPADSVSAQQGDSFTTYRIDEQIAKGLDRKVWLPSGGSLVIDRTEAMTVVDVNTGKFTGSGGNLEETVTKNNLEAAEEIVRQLRLRDIGGIIVVDFIDMVLESNRDLVLRRMVECLGRDRTRHQVAEVTSLGLVQMTRKRIGTGLLEAFSTDCDHCHGRGIVTHTHPIEARSGAGDEDGRRGRRNRGKGEKQNAGQEKGAPEQRDNAPVPVAEPIVEREVEAPSRAAETTQAPVEAPSADSAGEQQAEGERRGRNRGRSRNRSRGGDQQADAPKAESVTTDSAPAEVPAEKARVQTRERKTVQTPTQTPERAPEAPAAAVVAPVAAGSAEAPAAPTVVTRTRTRGGASRTASTTTVVTPTPVADIPVVPAFVPVAAAPADDAESRPTVVTRTRVRGGARSAPTTEPSEATATSSSVTGEEPVVEHVPVKNKGTRKR